MIHHTLVHYSSSELVTQSPITPHLMYVSSSSAKLNVVTTIGVDGCFGDEATKTYQLLRKPLKQLVDLAVRLLPLAGLIVKHGRQLYQKEKL